MKEDKSKPHHCLGKGSEINTASTYKLHKCMQPTPETRSFVLLLLWLSQHRGLHRLIAKCLNAVLSGLFCIRPCKSPPVTHHFIHTHALGAGQLREPQREPAWRELSIAESVASLLPFLFFWAEIGSLCHSVYKCNVLLFFITKQQMRA